MDAVDIERAGTDLSLIFEGSFTGRSSGSVVQTAFGGDGLDLLQGDSDVAGRFPVLVYWSLAGIPARPSDRAAKVTDWAYTDVTVWPLAYGR